MPLYALTGLLQFGAGLLFATSAEVVPARQLMDKPEPKGKPE